MLQDLPVLPSRPGPSPSGDQATFNMYVQYVALSNNQNVKLNMLLTHMSEMKNICIK